MPEYEVKCYSKTRYMVIAIYETNKLQAIRHLNYYVRKNMGYREYIPTEIISVKFISMGRSFTRDGANDDKTWFIMTRPLRKDEVNGQQSV